jgi:hypothetical protein
MGQGVIGRKHPDYSKAGVSEFGYEIPVVIPFEAIPRIPKKLKFHNVPNHKLDR